MGIREKWEKRWNYVKKLQFFLVVIILTMTLTAILVSTVSSVSFLIKRNEQYVSEQLSAMASEYDSMLEQSKTVAFSLVMDKNVQKYCSFNELDKEMNEEGGNVYSMLMNVLYMQNNANFMVIVNKYTGTYIYNGNYSLSESRFESVWQQDYESSIQAKGQGSLRISFADNYYRDQKNTMSLYFPVYSVTNMVTENGMVIINLEDSFLEHLNNRTRYTYSSLYLTDIDGNIVSNSETGEIGRQIEFAEFLKGSSGGFWYQNSFVNYQRVGDWNYYLINEVPTIQLYQSSFGIIILLLSVMMVFLGVSLFVSGKMARLLFRPMNKVIAKMNNVSSGDLRTRINTSDMDMDSRKLADGFNSMMEEIDVLMKQVAREQQQIAQLKFNGLQSQIQPHFLYNTLECIHWQALADGNKETSTMIKALAQYYRICLSEGQDVITLQMEIEHVRNYLIIQNLRYDNIIKLNVQVPEEYMGLKIPKITLQPLVENSIYHGIRVKEGRTGTISIYIMNKDERLSLIIDDDGQGMSPEKVDYINQNISEFDREIGYGINNVNKRIEFLLGCGRGLHYSLNEKGGVRVRIDLEEEDGDV